MTRFDVQKGALVGAPSETAVPTAKKSQAFSIARYEAQEKRRKQALARKLLQLVYPNRHLIISGDLCYVQPTVTESGITIPNYMSRLCHHVPADVWEKLPRTDRYAAIDYPKGISYACAWWHGVPSAFQIAGHSRRVGVLDCRPRPQSLQTRAANAGRPCLLRNRDEQHDSRRRPSHAQW